MEFTIAARGEPYMMILRPAQRNPSTSIFISPCSNSSIMRIAAAGNPTSNNPTSNAVLA